MLHKLKDLSVLTLKAVDGEIGSVHDIYFDDQNWMSRYVVVDTGPWLFGRRVLIDPSAFGQVDDEEGTLQIFLTKEQIKNSPEIDLEKPVSRQQEIELFDYYHWPPYWNGIDAPAPSAEAAEIVEERKKKELTESDPTLRSGKEVIGYHIQGTDDEVGHVEDFVVDETTWMIRYLVVDTRNWLPGRKVLVSPAWINRVSWFHSKVFLDLPRQTIEQSPEYDESKPIERVYEKMLFEYYGSNTYWTL